MAKNWFSITAKGSDTTEISIFDAIGATWEGEGVTAAQFITQLQAVKTPKILLLVNSPGGNLFDGLAIYNALSRSGAEVTGRVMGYAASAATVVLMACKTIEMPANTHLMLHKSSGGVRGTADDMRAFAEVMDGLDGSIIATYAARTGKPVEDVSALLSAGDLWLTAAQAKDLGMVDEVLPLVEVTASFDLAKLPAAVRASLAPPAPPAPPAVPLADTIKALADEAGLGVHASVFALDVTLTTPALARAAIDKAREVVALANVVGKPEMAAQFVTARTSYSDACAAIAAALAEADEQVRISNAPPLPAPAPAKPATSGPVALWSAISAA